MTPVKTITVPNSSCGKVVFSQVSVILLRGGVHGRGMHGRGVHGRGTCMAGGHAWQGDKHGRGHAWQGGHVWWGLCMVGVGVAGETATAADGTHPTGMHSCFKYFNPYKYDG